MPVILKLVQAHESLPVNGPYGKRYRLAAHAYNAALKDLNTCMSIPVSTKTAHAHSSSSMNVRECGCDLLAYKVSITHTAGQLHEQHMLLDCLYNTLPTLAPLDLLPAYLER